MEKQPINQSVVDVAKRVHDGYTLNLETKNICSKLDSLDLNTLATVTSHIKR